MKRGRTFLDRIHDRLWREWTDRLTLDERPIEHPDSHSIPNQSVSGSMDWPNACSSLKEGTWSSQNFRRRRAVRQVVETLGPVDGRHHISQILSNGSHWLTDRRIWRIDDWGDPIKWPAILLGTSRPFSPSTLRYLAHAVWLKNQSMVGPAGAVVEIGAGFGGLAAINAVVSSCPTFAVDLPNVLGAVSTAMTELGLGDFLLSGYQESSRLCAVSNYAFSELSSDLQDRYIDLYLRRCTSGMIISNASAFATQIGGRTDMEIVSALSKSGIHAKICHHSPVLGPADHMIGGSLIYWNQHA